MQIVVISGDTGAGKSTEMARIGRDLLWRNYKFARKTGTKRLVVSNLRFAPHIEELYGFAEDGGLIKYWDDPRELVTMRHVDVLWDEIAAALDATQWANMSLELKRWFQQHRKFGIDIVATTQDFDQIDKSARRLCHVLYYITKVIGSPDISATRPVVKFVWGLMMIKSVDPKTWDPAKIKHQGMLPTFRFLRSENVHAFDTTQEIKRGKFPPLVHLERDCELDNCTYHKVVHV